MPEAAVPIKPRRWGLYAPFVVLAIAAVVWSLFWVQMRSQVLSAMDMRVQALRQAGYQLDWKSRKLDGYPFRLDITLTEVQVRDPSGWGLDMPRLEAEAYLHSAGHWVMAAPDGLTLARPLAGRLTVRGEVLRASLSQTASHPPRFSFEGLKLTFAPQAGAQAFPLLTADRLEFHTRPGPDDQGAILAKLDGGQASGGALSVIAGG